MKNENPATPQATPGAPEESTSPSPASLADTKVMPRPLYDIPAGLTLLNVGDIKREGDLMLIREAEFFQRITVGGVGEPIVENGNFYFRPIAIEPTPQAPRDGAERLEDGSGFFVPAQAPEGTSPAEWVEPEHGWRLEAHRLSGLRSLDFKEIDGLKAQVSILIDALSRARAVVDEWVDADQHMTAFLAMNKLLKILESPALVALTQPDGGVK